MYAVSKQAEKEDESDESDEDDDIVPLANATDIPDEGDIELSAEVESNADSAAPPSFATEAVDDTASTVSSLSSLSSGPSSTLVHSRSASSLSSLTSIEEIPPFTTPASKSTFRSIISTRRQKRQAEEQALTSQPVSSAVPVPFPPSTTLAVQPATVSPPKKRITRSVSTLIAAATTSTDAKGKGKEKASITPPAHTPTPSRVKALRGDVKVKKEDSEPPRMLRTRLGAVTCASEVNEPPKPPDIPRDADGKPLPLCATCSNILPVISVDSEVVWGLELAKKKTKLECPRFVISPSLQGHFLIVYQGACVILTSMVNLGQDASIYLEAHLHHKVHPVK